MTIDEMLAGDWKVLVGEVPADLAMSVTFGSGNVVMHGVEVGAYALDGEFIVATIGEDVTLKIGVPDLSPVLPGVPALVVNVLQASMVTKIPDDDELLEEYASLVRQRFDVVADEEVRRRAAG